MLSEEYKLSEKNQNPSVQTSLSSWFAGLHSYTLQLSTRYKTGEM